MSGGVRVVPKYVIIDEFDAPEPEMVCQMVDGVGYCYLDRRGTKPSHDGMKGSRATPVERFGFAIGENANGTVTFYPTGQEIVAQYSDGVPRKWQSPMRAFEHVRLAKTGRQKRVRPIAAPTTPDAAG